MNDMHAPQHDERRRDGQQGGELVGRELEMDRIGAFLAAARTAGGTLLVTGEPGVGKTGLLNAASEAASALGTSLLRAAGVEFEAATSFSDCRAISLMC